MAQMTAILFCTERFPQRCRHSILAFILTLLLACTAVFADSLVLIDNGKPASTVVIPDSADSWTRMAAGWLVDYLNRASGAELSVVRESDAPSGALVSVGHTQMAANAGVVADDLSYDGCRMVVVGQVLYLIGRDSAGRDGAVPEPKEAPWQYHLDAAQSKRALATGPKGTCRAVVTFLETFCGVRWLAPSRQGDVVPQGKRIEVPLDLRHETNPKFSFWINSFYGSQMSRPAAYANNIRCAIQMRHYGGHSYYYWFSAGLFKDHPEYFILYNGQRSNVGNHVCPSNPEVRKILLRGLQADFDAGYEWVELGQSDGHQPCQCDACHRMSPDSNRRMLLLHQWICQEAAKSHPDKTVMLLAYGPTKNPYPDIQFGDNVIIELTGASTKLLEKWKGHGRGITVYPYWLDDTLGMGYGSRMGPADASQVIRLYDELGVIGLYVPSSGVSWGLMGPTYYVFGKMMGDPSLDYRPLVNEYCRGLYGAAAEAMEDFFTVLYSRSYWKLHFEGGVPANIAESIKHLYPPQFIQGLDERLVRAEQAADSERARMWVKMTRDEFDYLKHMSYMLAVYDAYLVNKSSDIFAELKISVDSFNTYRRRIVSLEGDRITDYFPSHGYLAKFLSTGANSGYYYGWWGKMRDETDFDRLDQSGVGYRAASSLNIPITLDFSAAQSKHEFRLKRTTEAPTLDGQLDESGWADAVPTVYEGAVATRVLGMYDNENIYIAFECDEPNIDQLRVKDFYRDGDVSALDCVEFLVSPETGVYATRYYHFLLAPAKDALLDLRTGFKEVRDQDESWNAQGLQWSYTIDAEAKKWTIEMTIPLKDINAAAPKPGTVWMGNLGRERYAGADELLLWSQGGSSGFTDAKAFGLFVFE